MSYFLDMATSRRITVDIVVLGIPARMAKYLISLKATILKVVSMSRVAGKKRV